MKNESLTLIITHEKMAMCLQHAVEKILGKQEYLFPYTTIKDSMPVLVKKINQNIKKIYPKHIVCFVDLAGGSCWNLANIIHKEHHNMTIISGVNMPMLISYFNHLNDLPFEELIKKAVIDGNTGIKQVKESS